MFSGLCLGLYQNLRVLGVIDKLDKSYKVWAVLETQAFSRGHRFLLGIPSATLVSNISRCILCCHRNAHTESTGGMPGILKRIPLRQRADNEDGSSRPSDPHELLGTGFIVSLVTPQQHRGVLECLALGCCSFRPFDVDVKSLSFMFCLRLSQTKHMIFKNYYYIYKTYDFLNYYFLSVYIFYIA